MRRLVWLIAAIALSTPCFAQNAPNIGPNLTNTTVPLTAAQKSIVEQYATFYADQLSGDDVDAASAARSRLSAPLNVPGTTDVFRNDYSAILLPLIEPIVAQQKNAFAALNAMQVASQLQTPGALSLAVGHLGESAEPRPAIRIWAAICFRETTGKLSSNPINANTVDAATRSMERAASTESDWLVLLRELQALGDLSTPIANTAELNVLESAIDRMAKEKGPSELVHAVFPAVISLRDRILQNRISTTALTVMGKRLGPILGKLLETPTDNWNELQNSESERTTYSKLISVTERTVQLVDRSVQPSNQQAPQTALRDSWDKKDRNKYDQDLKRWMDRLDAPPYEPVH